MRKSIALLLGFAAVAACESDRTHSEPVTNSTVSTDVKQVGRDMKAGVEKAGDKLQEGVHTASEKIKDAAKDVKEDFKR